MRTRAGPLDAPAVGSSQPEQRFSSVVLPQPDGPDQRDELAAAHVERQSRSAPRTAPNAMRDAVERSSSGVGGHRS